LPKAAKAALDRIDRRILARLQAGARITNLELAAAVGLSPSACLQRVRRLEAAGVLGPYLAEIELDKVARSVTVIATVTLGSHRQRDFARFEAAVAAMPEIVDAFKVSGGFDYVLRFVCADMAAYHAASENLLKAGPNVAQLQSHVALQRVKPFRGYDLERLL